MASAFLRAKSARARDFILLLIVTAVPRCSASGALLMTIDPPHPPVLDVGARSPTGARRKPGGQGRTGSVTGLAMGLGFLCKYSAAYQIAHLGDVLFAMWPGGARAFAETGAAHGSRCWFFLLCATARRPIWNCAARLDHHPARRRQRRPEFPVKFTLRHVGDFLGGEFGLLNPVFLYRFRRGDVRLLEIPARTAIAGFIFCMSAPVLLGHLLYSFHSDIKLNWIAPAVPPVFLFDGRLLAGKIARRFKAGQTRAGDRPRARFCRHRATMTPTSQARCGQPLPGEIDPSRRVRAWQPTAVWLKPLRKTRRRRQTRVHHR